MTSERHSVDDLLVMGTPTPVSEPNEAEVKPVESQSQEIESKVEPVEAVHVENDDYGIDNHQSETTPVESQSIASNDVETAEDEYGNAVAKPKMYSEEDVQRMIRERLARGSNREQQPTSQQVQDAASNFNYDENSSETWQQQLDGFVRQTVKNISQEQVDQQRRAQEQAVTQAFEAKFQTGMTKYPDFVQTISDKPITDAMMHGIRGLDNPAAFLYAAAKMQPTELERISKIPDVYQQVAEMGRLHERMRVKRKTSSNASKPIKPSNGDIVDNTPYKVSIDHRIAEHAKEKVRR